jgi:hypothetical protein
MFEERREEKERDVDVFYIRERRRRRRNRPICCEMRDSSLLLQFFTDG